jgi:hypothetical protein
MDKSTTSSSSVVRDSRTGRFVTVRGAGALKSSPFKIGKDIDLTKPIAAQALGSDKKRKSAKG